MKNMYEIELDYKRSMEIMNRGVDVANNAGDIRGAIELYKEAIDVCSENIKAYSNLLFGYVQLNDIMSAADYLNQYEQKIQRLSERGYANNARKRLEEHKLWLKCYKAAREVANGESVKAKQLLDEASRLSKCDQTHALVSIIQNYGGIIGA